MSTVPDQKLKEPLRVGVLWRYAADSALYRPWMESGSDRLQFVTLEDYHPDIPLPDLDVLVTHMHYRWDELAILRKTLTAGKTAVLVIADGILEYRNTWENPNIPSGSILRPAFAHKIAALGVAQSRILDSWGNGGKCEIVGMPRLDTLACSQGWWIESPETPVELNTDGDTKSGNSKNTEYRLLICSATTPAFNAEQWETVFTQFRDLATSIDQWNESRTPKLIPQWRVAKEISDSLGLPPSDKKIALHDAILAADAVITTPSTIQLESMLARKPTVLLDYFPVPRYVPAAWSISSSDHFETVFQELIGGCPARDSYQNTLIREQLWTEDSATDRMLLLIEAMGSIARQAKHNKKVLQFPASLLPVSKSTIAIEEIENLINVSLTNEIQQVSADTNRLQQDLQIWMEATETQAAIQRANDAAADRAQLFRIEKAMLELQHNYEGSLDEKRIQIADQTRLLDAAAERHKALNVLLDSRNEEFERVQQRVKELAAAREEDHQLLSAAHADAKAKQQRVIELRERNQTLLTRIEELNNRLTKLSEQSQPLASHQKELLEANQKLKETHKSLLARIEELVEERKQLYERLKKANSTK